MKEEYVEGVLETPTVSEQAIPEQLKGAVGQAAGSLQQLPAPMKDAIVSGLKIPLGKQVWSLKTSFLAFVIVFEASLNIVVQLHNWFISCYYGYLSTLSSGPYDYGRLFPEQLVFYLSISQGVGFLIFKNAPSYTPYLEIFPLIFLDICSYNP